MARHTHLRWTAVCATFESSKTRGHEAAVNSTSHADVIKLPRLPTVENMRGGVKDAVASGGIVDWRQAGEWLRQAREDGGEVGLGDYYTRVLVRMLFDHVSNLLRCDARVVNEKRGPDAGDGNFSGNHPLPKQCHTK